MKDNVFYTNVASHHNKRYKQTMRPFGEYLHVVDLRSRSYKISFAAKR